MILAWKKADISRRLYWFPREITTEQRLYESYTDDVSLLRSG